MAITTDTTPSSQSFALFEGSSIKQFIIDQLTEGGIFTDQQYLGSNLNAFIDIIAVMLQQIQFHYNTTASESTFATASLYENMNKLVSLFNYKPNGKQTSILPVEFTCSIHEAGLFGTYLLPRYTYINYNKQFVLKEDITFTVTEAQDVKFDDILYQGTLTESDKYECTGEDFQVFTLIDTDIKGDSGKFITDNFFDVYVREPGGKWVQYAETTSLFDNKATDKVFEKRLNENYNYEFKLGNSINGYCPKVGSELIIFYLVSDGSDAQVGDGVINNTDVYLYNSTNFNEIIMDTETGIFDSLPSYVPSKYLEYFVLSNTGYSTPVSAVETVEVTRNLVPKLFTTQNRLLTANDYITYINKKFNNFVKDCYVFNNSTYTSEYLKYYYDVGLSVPNNDPRVALNQVYFQTSCAFNNIYIILLPLINTIIEDKIPNYVNTALKQYVTEGLESYKDMAHCLVPIDPIYKAVSFGINRTSNNTLPEHFDDVQLVLVRDKYSAYNSDYITSEAVRIFNEFFESVALGSTIDISEISAQLAQIAGVTKIKMTDGTNTINKLTFIVWNPLYPYDDFMVTQQNYLLSDFMYPYFYDLQNINSRITVEDE